MAELLRTYEANVRGRDFVVGDLHGTLPALLRLLDGVNFDPAADRVFSVGDLEDRGPDSMGCLRLLREPWFHAVLANHEQLMLHAFEGGPYGDFWYGNGGNWGYEAAIAVRQGRQAMLDDEQRELVDELLPLVRGLPFLMTVERPAGWERVHILHAELPPGARPTDAELSSPGVVERLATANTGDGEAFLWSRFKFGQFSRADVAGNMALAARKAAYHALQPVPGLSHLLSGHTIVQRPLVIAGQTNLDTGAYMSARENAPAWAALTALELGEWRFHQATPAGYRGTVEPVVVEPANLAGG